jgi:hypothetical protein
VKTFKRVVDRVYSEKNPTGINGFPVRHCEQGTVVTKVSRNGILLFDSLSEVN